MVKKLRKIGDTLETPFGTILWQGEPQASTMLRIYHKMVVQGDFDIYKAGKLVGLSRDEVDDIVAKEDIKLQVQNIKNSRKFQEAEKTSDSIMSLQEKFKSKDGTINPAVLSNVRQHTEFILDRLGKNAGYTTRTENVNVNIELSPERREQLSRIIDITEE